MGAATNGSGDVASALPEKRMQPMEVETARSHRLLRSRSSLEEVHTPQGAMWLFVCFIGYFGSFILYNLVLEYGTSGGRRLHELSLIFITSSLSCATAHVGRHVRGEKPTDVPPGKLMLLAMTSMGSTYCSMRALKYVIYPIQVRRGGSGGGRGGCVHL
jgi:hypothetical protein